MSEPVSVAEIPGRIIRRYTENLNFIINSVSSFIQQLSSSDDILKSLTSSGPEQFGFEKLMILLTKPNKVIAVSSMDGSVRWSFYENKEIEKLFVKQTEGQFKVVLVMKDALVSLDPQTGNLISKEAL